MSEAPSAGEISEGGLEQGIPYNEEEEDAAEAHTRGRHVSIVTSPLKMGDVYKLRDKRISQIRRLRSTSSYSESSFDGSVDTGNLLRNINKISTCDLYMSLQICIYIHNYCILL